MTQRNSVLTLIVWLAVLVASALGIYSIGVSIETGIGTLFLATTTVVATNKDKIKEKINRIIKESYCI